MPTYGASRIREQHYGCVRQVGIYAGRVLTGEKPGDPPVVQLTQFEFVINRQRLRSLASQSRQVCWPSSGRWMAAIAAGNLNSETFWDFFGIPSRHWSPRRPMLSLVAIHGGTQPERGPSARQCAVPPIQPGRHGVVGGWIVEGVTSMFHILHHDLAFDTAGPPCRIRAAKPIASVPCCRGITL